MHKIASDHHDVSSDHDVNGEHEEKSQTKPTVSLKSPNEPSTNAVNQQNKNVRIVNSISCLYRYMYNTHNLQLLAK